MSFFIVDTDPAHDGRLVIAGAEHEAELGTEVAVGLMHLAGVLRAEGRQQACAAGAARVQAGGDR